MQNGCLGVVCVEDLPVEAIAYIELHENIFDIVVAASRDSLLDWVVTLATIAGFVLVRWLWSAYSLISLILLCHGLGTAADKFLAVLDTAQ